MVTEPQTHFFPPSPPPPPISVYGPLSKPWGRLYLGTGGKRKLKEHAVQRGKHGDDLQTVQCDLTDNISRGQRG